MTITRVAVAWGTWVRELDQVEFKAWAPIASRELGALVLFRLDPEGTADEYPASLDDYAFTMHTVVIGLWRGDDRAAFVRRLRNQPGVEQWPDSDVDRLYDLIGEWLPKSLAHWWRQYSDTMVSSLPYFSNVLPPDDGSRPADVERTLADVARDVIAESGATLFREGDDRTLELDAGAALTGIAAALAHPAASVSWSSVDLGLVIGVCEDGDLHVSGRVPFDEVMERARRAGLRVESDRTVSPPARSGGSAVR